MPFCLGLRLSLLLQPALSDFEARMLRKHHGSSEALPNELDIYRSAQVLIRQHGGDASIFAAMRVDKLFAAGDLDGSRVWRPMLRAIKVLAEERAGRTLH